jgi:hypothetical protein
LRASRFDFKPPVFASATRPTGGPVLLGGWSRGDGPGEAEFYKTQLLMMKRATDEVDNRFRAIDQSMGTTSDRWRLS